jgi:hypothetical protein
LLYRMHASIQLQSKNKKGEGVEAYYSTNGKGRSGQRLEKNHGSRLKAYGSNLDTD